MLKISAHVGSQQGAHHVAVSTNGSSRATESAIRELALHTDTVAEIQNTLRRGMRVALTDVVAESSGPGNDGG